MCQCFVYSSFLLQPSSQKKVSAGFKSTVWDILSLLIDLHSLHSSLTYMRNIIIFSLQLIWLNLCVITFFVTDIGPVCDKLGSRPGFEPDTSHIHERTYTWCVLHDTGWIANAASLQSCSSNYSPPSVLCCRIECSSPVFWQPSEASVQSL